MDEPFKFKVGNGNIELNVGEFFASSGANTIKKMLKLIDKNCKPEQKEELLNFLHKELCERMAVLNRLPVLVCQIEHLLTPFVTFNPAQFVTKRKALEKQCEKISKYIEILNQSKG